MLIVRKGSKNQVLAEPWGRWILTQFKFNPLDIVESSTFVIYGLSESINFSQKGQKVFVWNY